MTSVSSMHEAEHPKLVMLWWEDIREKKATQGNGEKRTKIAPMLWMSYLGVNMILKEKDSWNMWEVYGISKIKKI